MDGMKNLEKTLNEAEMAADLRQKSTDMVYAFGIDPKMRGDKFYEQVRTLLLPSAKEILLSRIRMQLTDTKRKVSSLWEKFLPEVPTKGCKAAAELVLTNTWFPWGELLNDPVIEAALTEQVAENFLESLTSAGMFVTDAEKWIAEWKGYCQSVGSDVAMACERLATDYAEQIVQSCDRGASDDAVRAMRTVRLFSYAIIHAHITGAVHTETAEQFSLRLDSTTIKSLRHSTTLSQSLGKIQLGNIRALNWGTRLPSPRELDVLRKSLNMDRNGSPLDALFEALLLESDSSTGYYDPNNVFVQVHKVMCPLLAYTPGYLLQKQMPPDVYYGLYHVAKKLQRISRETLYPYLGTGIGLSEVPEGFVTRFPTMWLRRNNLTPAMLLVGGFSPIQHSGMRVIIADMYARLPGFKAALEQNQQLYELKLAHTFNTWIKPVLETVIQTELSNVVRELNPQLFVQMRLRAYKNADPKTYGAVSVEQFEKLKHVLDYRTENAVRNELWRESINYLRTIQNVDKRVEAILMGDRKETLWRLRSHGQPFPAVENLDAIPESNNSEIPEYSPTFVPYVKLDEQYGAFLSDDHFKGLSMTHPAEKGVLWPETLAMQGLFSTYDPALVAKLYSHYTPSLAKRLEPECRRWVYEAGATGLLVIRYLHKQASDNSVYGIPVSRFRTCSADCKYRSIFLEGVKRANPDSNVQANPLYLYAPLVDEAAHRAMREKVIRVGISLARGEVDGHMTSYEEASAVLDAAGYGRLLGCMNDPTVPVFAMEGEKKILAVATMQEMTFARLISSVLRGDIGIEDVKHVPIVCPIGTIGVWLTRKVEGTRTHELIPEITSALPLANRMFIIGHDSDGMRNSNVVYAAVKAAECLAQQGARPMYWRSPIGEGKGFDDYVECTARNDVSGLSWEVRVYHAYETMYNKFWSRVKAIRPNIDLKMLEQAKAAGKDLQKYIVGV